MNKYIAELIGTFGWCLVAVGAQCLPLLTPSLVLDFQGFL